MNNIELYARELRNELETVIYECEKVIARLDNGNVSDTLPTMLYAKTIQRRLREEMMELMNTGVSGFDIVKEMKKK